MLVIGEDLGGSKLSAVLVATDHTVVHRTWVNHQVTSYADVVGMLGAVVDDCKRVARDLGSEVSAVGVAVAGCLSRDRERLLHAANLGCRNRALASDLRRRCGGLPVVIDNDGNAAALAELHVGAAIGSHTLVLITLGTGVGGGIVVDGQPLIGARGLAAELGHLPVTDDGADCWCGGRGCLELVASGPGIARAAGVATSVEAVDAARAGQPAALDALRAAGRHVGEALVSIFPVVDPDLVLLGGSVSQAAGQFLLPTVRAVIRKRRVLRVVTAAVPVGLAALGPEAGALGAAELALQLVNVSQHAELSKAKEI